jgi:mono/diheme cytochrome c family protein
LLLVQLFLLSSSAYRADAQEDAAAGKALFETHCTSCHAIDKKMIGPALKDVHKKHQEAWLLSWVKNSSKMIAAGDPMAVKLFNENGKMPMNSFENLSDIEIKNILAYVKSASEAPAQNDAAAPATAGGTTTVANAPEPAGDSFYSSKTLWTLVILACVLLLVSLILWRINSVFKKFVVSKHPEFAAETEPSWWDSRFMPWVKTRNPTISALVIILVIVVLSGGWYFEYANLEIGVQQDYAPTQPINFSHELHAGQYKIDCQYCHTTASKGKQASVPDVSTCMNCHKYIDAKDKYGGDKVSPEIQKVRDAYEKNEPIKWVRIHNLPDLSYFNHAQHVAVGKVECQACHGPVETMVKVKQHASLQMGWCVNCHRESEVDVANNAYYEKLHEDLKKNGRVTTSVAGNGGLDCSKCHY